MEEKIAPIATTEPQISDRNRGLRARSTLEPRTEKTEDGGVDTGEAWAIGSYRT